MDVNYPIESVAGGVRLNLLVQPRASRTEMVGVHDGRIKIRLAAPPVEGAANAALLKFLAKQLGVSVSAISLLSGSAARRKAVLVKGLAADQADVLLQLR